MVAGLLDASLASLATFVAGVYAVRVLDPESLGAYALCYQAVFLACILPANLIFSPAEVAVVAHARDRRIERLGRSLRIGAPVALAGGLLSVVWVLVAPRGIGWSTLGPLALTGAAMVFLSPIQDHVRRILHSGGDSWRAVAVSATQLGGVVGAIALLNYVLEVPPAWVPFGALAAANLLSLLVGLTSPRALSGGRDGMPVSELLVPGRWIFLSGLMSPAAGFLAAALVSALAGAEALGYAEAARVIAQPVWVLAVGLSQVLGPRSMEAGRDRDRAHARSVSRTFTWAVIVTGALCMVTIGAPWEWNPLTWLLPNAYTVPYLVLMTLFAQTLTGTLFPYRSELLGGRREAALTSVEAASGVARIGVAASAPVTLAYAVPLGYLAVGAARALAYVWLLGELYGRRPQAAPSAGQQLTAVDDEDLPRHVRQAR
jgi:O-antigen/teichoic acid export membrane protein